MYGNQAKLLLGFTLQYAIQWAYLMEQLLQFLHGFAREILIFLNRTQIHSYTTFI